MIFTLQNLYLLDIFTVIIILNKIIEFVRMERRCSWHTGIGYKMAGCAILADGC